jgi:toxin-antitoxin system PIN domain toxin
VILPDTNVLIYAINENASQYAASRALLDEHIQNQQRIFLPWSVLLAFLRLATGRFVFPSPLSVDEAISFIDRLLALPNVVVVEPGPLHIVTLRTFLQAVGAGGNLVPDAHLAALAIERNATLYSFDRDFGRFPKLKWRIPGA